MANGTYKASFLDQVAVKLHLTKIPISIRTISVPITLFLGMITFIVQFNRTVIDQRMDELNYLFNFTSESQDKNKSLQMLMKYTMLKDRADGKKESIDNTIKEAKIKIMMTEENPEIITEFKGVMPVLAGVSISGLRFLLGKEDIKKGNTVSENKVMYKAYLYERSREYENAVREYLNVLKTELTEYEKYFIYLHIAYCYSFIDKIEDAAKYYQKVIDEYPGTEVATVAFKLLAWINSIRKETQSIAFEKSDLEKGLKYYKYMNLNKAISIFSEIIIKDGNDKTKAQYYRARSYEDQGKTQLALNDYEKVITQVEKGGEGVDKKWAKKANRRSYVIHKVEKKNAKGIQIAHERMAKMQDIHMIDMVDQIQETANEKEKQVVAITKKPKEVKKVVKNKTDIVLTKDDYHNIAQEFLKGGYKEKALKFLNKSLITDNQGNQIKKKKVKEKEKSADKGKDIDEKDTEISAVTFSQIGDIERSLGNLERAKDAFTHALKLEPESIENQQDIKSIEKIIVNQKIIQEKIAAQKIIDEANNVNVEGDIEEGVEEIEVKIVEEEFNEILSAEEYKLKAAMLMQKRKSEKAIDLLKTAMAMEPKNDDLKFELGKAYLISKKFKESADFFQTLSKRISFEKRERSFEFLGQSYYAMKKLKYAIKAYKNALDINPDSRNAQKGLVFSRLDFRTKQFKVRDKKEVLERVNIEVVSNQATAAKMIAENYARLGNELMAKGKIESAIENYNKAILNYEYSLDLNPEMAEINARLLSTRQKLSAQLLFSSRLEEYQDNSRAIVLISKLDNYDDEIMRNTHTNLAKVYIESENFDEALVHLSVLKRLSPDDDNLDLRIIETEQNLATMYFDLGNDLFSDDKEQEALAMFKLASDVNPTFVISSEIEQKRKVVEKFIDSRVELEGFEEEMDEAISNIEELIKKIRESRE